MTLRSTLLLAGALLAVASQAQAVTPTPSFPNAGGTSSYIGTAIFGGGASLPAPYLRQASDCWGEKIDLAFIDKTATQSLADFNYTGSPVFNCATQTVSPTNVVSYISTGSGRGILGWFAHTGFYNNDPTGATPTATTYDSWLSTLAAGSGIAPAVYATKVNFAASEAGIPQTDPAGGGDIDTYNGTKLDGSGNSIGATVKQSNQLIAIQSASGANAPTTPALSGVGYQFPNPLKTYGKAIQIPLLIAIPTIALDPVYKKVVDGSGNITETAYKNFKSGTIKLTNTQLCNVFNGVDTNFGQDGLAATFGLQGTATTVGSDFANASNINIQIVGRSDGSGTTSIVLRHLAKICPALIGANAKIVADGVGNVGTAIPSALRNTNNYIKGQAISVSPAGETVGKFTRADGNDGVAEYLNFSRIPNDTNSGTVGVTTLYQTRIGYVGNDYVTPYVNTQQNNYGLISTLLQNNATAIPAFVSATPATATKAFGSATIPASNLLPPQTTSAGLFSATAGGRRSDPATHPDPVHFSPASSDTATYHTWVSAANIASPLADPTIAGAYPLVGTTNGLFYQCYADAKETAVIKAFLSWFYGNKTVIDPTKGVLALNGLAPLTKPYLTAIVQTFIGNQAVGTPAAPLNLDFGTVGVNSAECGAVTTGA